MISIITPFLQDKKDISEIRRERKQEKKKCKKSYVDTNRYNTDILRTYQRLDKLETDLQEVKNKLFDTVAPDLQEVKDKLFDGSTCSGGYFIPDQ